MKVRDIIRPVHTVASNSKLSDAISEMSKNHVNALVVTNNNKIAGFLDEDEILDNLGSLSEEVSEFMIKNVKTIDDDEELSEAAEIMNREGVHKLPVIKGGKLVGIVTATDLIAHAGELSEVFLFD